MTTSYRPQVLWILMGPLLGAPAGTAVGAVLALILITSESPATGVSDVLGAVGVSLIVGAVYGGTTGAVTGFFVGLPLVFLVGRHLPRDVARRRAWVLGGVLPPVALVVTFSVISGEVWIVTEVPQGDGWWSVLWLLVPSALGGPLAAKAAALDAPQTPTS